MSRRPAPAVDLRRARDRFHTRTDGLDSWHSFSFGAHHDSANTHHGLLIAHNDDRLDPGAGFDSHPHHDMEIVTWVLAGALAHEDSTGRRGEVYPGLAQRMSAGRGIVHSERNASSAASSVHFIQMWVPPDARGADPGYEQSELDQGDLAAGWVPIASGLAEHRASTAVRINNSQAALSAATLASGTAVELPDAPYVHLFVASGAVTVEGLGLVSTGDAVRLTGGSGHRVRADNRSELLVWQMFGDAFS